MTLYISRRIMLMAITVFVVSMIVFFMVRLRGDPVTQMAPPWYTPEQLDALRRAWGLDGPLWEQYLTFLRRALTGDFGRSIRYQRQAMDLVLDRIPMTLLLAGVSAAVALIFAIPLGVLSALKRNTIIDLIVTILATIGAAMPNFWFGLMLILFFSVQLRLLPAFGALSPESIIMPAATLAFAMMGRLSRLTRSAMLEVLGQDYIRTARAKGLNELSTVFVHALRNAILPVITAFGLQLGWLLGGSVVVEQVFAWPGLGRLMLEAVGLRDLTVVQAGVFWFALTFIVINLTMDVLYTVVDPRIRYT
jgi:peptide/nickel transport system permease protein